MKQLANTYYGKSLIQTYCFKSKSIIKSGFGGKGAQLFETQLNCCDLYGFQLGLHIRCAAGEKGEWAMMAF